jgi:hypothetical protein
MTAANHSSQALTGSRGRGVIVLGTHRSGTSALTGVLGILGLPSVQAGDTFPVSRWNARGNFESRSLSGFDDQLLRALGGAWWAPPALPPGWAADPRLDPYRESARAIFDAAHPGPRWAWKDPRACVLMPFWDTILDPQSPRIVVLRHPAESVASLAARGRIEEEVALALGERSVRSALHDSAGRAVMVTTFDALLGNVGAWCELAEGFLTGQGFSLSGLQAVEEAKRFLEPSLRHHQRARMDGSEAAQPWWPLWEWAIARQGNHPGLDIEGLPPESPGTTAVLDAVCRRLQERALSGAGPKPRHDLV